MLQQADAAVRIVELGIGKVVSTTSTSVLREATAIPHTRHRPTHCQVPTLTSRATAKAHSAGAKTRNLGAMPFSTYSRATPKAPCPSPEMAIRRASAVYLLNKGSGGVLAS